MPQPLPKGLLDLIEHVELNRSGWWDAALSNVLLAGIWMHGRPVRRGEVGDLIFSAFSLEIPADRIADHIGRLVRHGSLTVSEDDHVAPASAVADEMQARLEAADQNEETVRAAFIEKVGSCCAPHSPEETWSLFTERYFLPLINVMGVRTLQLMGGGVADDADVAAITDGFFGLFDPSHHADLRLAIASFLDPDDPSVRRYVAEHLDASLLVRASGLTNDAIAEISRFGKKTPTFRFFLDTNFLFSLLDLHENPSNESAQMLGNTIQRVSKHLSIRMHVISPTIDEVKRTLRASQADLMGMRMVPTLADAALDLGISGIALRFARANREAKRPITSQEYFEPFLRGLTPILRAKGVDVYNARVDGYRQRQDVVDDLHEMMGPDAKSESARQRRYNAALHDSILWHFVSDKRPAVFESPLEAGFWVVTNDYRLINFDRRRRRSAGSAAGVCIHPAELVQILRLWEPRSTDMEQALTSGLRLPFMFYEFDPGQEAASMRVLKALSRFEHIDYLAPDAIRDIVLNDAVRAKTLQATSTEEETEIIRDALLAERNEIVGQRDAAVQKAGLAEATLHKEREAAHDRAVVEKEERVQSEQKISELKAELQDTHGRTYAMGERITSLEAMLDERNYRERTRSARVRVALVRGVGGGVVTASVAAGLGFGWAMLSPTQLLMVSLSMLAVWIIGWFLVLTTAHQETSVREWAPIRFLLNLRSRATWWFGALVIAIVGNAVWQEVIHPNWFG